MLRIKHEVAQEEVKGIQVDNICEQLNAPLALQEVISFCIISEMAKREE